MALIGESRANGTTMKYAPDRGVATRSGDSSGTDTAAATTSARIARAESARGQHTVTADQQDRGTAT